MKLPLPVLLALATALATVPAAAVDMTPLAEPEAAAPVEKLAAARYMAAGNKFVASP